MKHVIKPLSRCTAVQTNLQVWSCHLCCANPDKQTVDEERVEDFVGVFRGMQVWYFYDVTRTTVVGAAVRPVSGDGSLPCRLCLLFSREEAVWSLLWDWQQILSR